MLLFGNIVLVKYFGFLRFLGRFFIKSKRLLPGMFGFVTAQMAEFNEMRSLAMLVKAAGEAWAESREWKWLFCRLL